MFSVFLLILILKPSGLFAGGRLNLSHRITMTDTSLTSNAAISSGSPGRRNVIAITALLASLIVVPYLIGDGFVYHVFITICIFAALSTAWNIVGGFAGQLSLGHAIFYGIGAYAGIILMNMGISPWLGMFVGAAVAVVVAARHQLSLLPLARIILFAGDHRVP